MSELIRLGGGPDASGDVIFVHGLDGDARGTWQLDGDPKTFWPPWVADDVPPLTVWTLDYDAHALDWSGASMPLTDRGGNVLDLIELHVAPGRPLFFVAHSLGGLLVKQIIRRAVDRRHRLATQTRGVVFLGTPHSGSQKASWLGHLGWLVRASVSASELEAHSAQLRDLNVWYREAAGDLKIRNRIYYETRTVKGLKIVDETSADPGIAGSAPIALDADHVAIAKVASRRDQLYLGVVRFLQDCLGTPNLGDSPIKARFQVKALDGHAPIDVGDVRGALPGGARFRLQLTNTGGTAAVIDAIRVRTEFRALPAAAPPRIDAAALRFGDVRVPHQLHLELRERTWNGRWMIQMSNGTSAIRAIVDGLDNLMDTDPPTEFDLAPGATESITGSITVHAPGVYTVSLEIEAVVLGTSTAPSRTEPLALVRFAPAGGSPDG
jgi:hypothetical protein